MNWYLGADYKKEAVVPESALDKEQDRQIGMEIAHAPAEQGSLLLRCCVEGPPLILSSSVTQCQHRSKQWAVVAPAEKAKQVTGTSGRSGGRGCSSLLVLMKIPFTVCTNSQERKRRRVFKNIPAVCGLKNLILHVCVSIHLNEGGGKSFQKLISQSSVGVRGAQAGRPEQRLQGSVFLPLVLVWVEEEERKAPPPLFLRRLKRKPKCGIYVFHKNSKSSGSYCFHRKNVIRGSEKAHVGLGTSAAQNCLENNWAAAWQNRNAAVHAGGPSGNHGAQQVVSWSSMLLIPRAIGVSQQWEGALGRWSRMCHPLGVTCLTEGELTQQQAARPTFGKQPSVLYRQVITNVLWRTVLPALLQK